MKNLRKRINYFYKHYDVNLDYACNISRAGMHNEDALMTAYESIWVTMGFYESGDPIYPWLTALYADLGNYMRTRHKWQSVTCGNIVDTFGEVVHQAWDCLINYHTIDIRWRYSRKGF